MKNYAPITDQKDVVTKEYADTKYSSNNPPPYPVTSVNGQTGAVSVSVPTALSQLSGDTTHRVVTDAEKTAWNGKENASNKTTTLSSASTNTQYPSAKAVYDLVNSIAPVYTLNDAGGYTVTIGRVE